MSELLLDAICYFQSWSHLLISRENLLNAGHRMFLYSLCIFVGFHKIKKKGANI